MHRCVHVLLCAVAVAALNPAVDAARSFTPPAAERTVDLDVDSGPVSNRADRSGTIYSTVVHVPDAAWVRLGLGATRLGTAPAGAVPTAVRITALRDGAVQTLTSRTLAEWQGQSAYFNGNTLLVEIVAAPGSGTSRLLIDHAEAGDGRPGFAESICGLNDDRELSSDPRVARTSPIGCTAFLIDDPNHCFLTAGHCFVDGSVTVVLFNVPLSNASGDLGFPGPEDQYIVDPASVQFSPIPTDGEDWAYFGCFPNTQTGLTPFAAQGASFELAAFTPPPSGQTIRVTGFGTTTAPISPTWNQAQKSHTGQFVSFLGSQIEYQVDTTDGNSGSPVIDETTGQVIGIHTSAGCEFGANSGTALNSNGLVFALANPQGVCNPCVPLDDCNANGLDDACDLDSGFSPDCNENGIPDECDTAGGIGDCNGNGTPDSCETDDLLVVESGQLAPFGGAKPQSVVLTDPPAAADNVTLFFNARADLESPTETVAIRVNGTTVETVYATANNCATTGNAALISVDAAVWNDALVAGGGTVEVTAAPNGFVDATDCFGASWVEITVYYSFVPPNDLNGNGVPDDCETPGDLDGSGVVGFGDLTLMLNAWGACPTGAPCAADLDGNGSVGFADLMILLANWG